MDMATPTASVGIGDADMPTRAVSIPRPQTGDLPATPVRVTREPRGIDLAGAERAAAQFLEALGIGTDTELDH